MVVVSLRGRPGCGRTTLFLFISHYYHLFGIDALHVGGTANQQKKPTNKRYLSDITCTPFVHYLPNAPHGVRLPRTIKLNSLRMAEWMTAQDHIAHTVTINIAESFERMHAELYVDAVELHLLSGIHWNIHSIKSTVVLPQKNGNWSKSHYNQFRIITIELLGALKCDVYNSPKSYFCLFSLMYQRSMVVW